MPTCPSASSLAHCRLSARLSTRLAACLAGCPRDCPPTCLPAFCMHLQASHDALVAACCSNPRTHAARRLYIEVTEPLAALPDIVPGAMPRLADMVIRHSDSQPRAPPGPSPQPGAEHRAAFPSGAAAPAVAAAAVAAPAAAKAAVTARLPPSWGASLKQLTSLTINDVGGTLPEEWLRPGSLPSLRIL